MDEQAKRRMAHPGVQRRLQRIKERDWETNTLPASQVFAQRLRERRKARGLSLSKLSHWMSLKGYPISTTALHSIEHGKRGLSLDEAFALTEALQAVPANMFIPPEGKLVRLSESLAVDGSGMRKWLVSGLPYRSDQDPAPEIADDVRREQSDRAIARLAQNFIDLLPISGEDGKAARAAAFKELDSEVRRRRREKT